MHIEFMGRAIRIRAGTGYVTLFPEEIYQIVSWAKEHEFQLLEKHRELLLMNEQRQQRQAKEQQCREE